MPPVSDKSWVTGEYVPKLANTKDGYPYIVVTEDEGVVFKLVYDQLDKNQTLLLCSTNPMYEPYEININEVHEI